MTRLPKIIAIHSRAPSAERILGPALRPEDKGKPWIEDVRWFFAIGAVMADNGTRREISYGAVGPTNSYAMVAFCKGFTLGDQTRAGNIVTHVDGRQNPLVSEAMLVSGFSAPIATSEASDVCISRSSASPDLLSRVNPSGILLIQCPEAWVESQFDEPWNKTPYATLPMTFDPLVYIPKP